VADAVWANVVRTLTNLSDVRAARIDNLDVLLSSRLSGSAFDTRLSAARAALIDNLDVLLSSREAEAVAQTRYASLLASVNNMRTEVDKLVLAEGSLIPLISAASLDDIAVTNPTDTTEREISFTLPPYGVLSKAVLTVYMLATNRTATSQSIGVGVSGRPSGGSWTQFFSQGGCIALPGVTYTNCPVIIPVNVISVVNDAGDYGFKCTIALSGAAQTRFLIIYRLDVAYYV